MSASVRLLNVANVTETFGRQNHWLNVSHAFDFCSIGNHSWLFISCCILGLTYTSHLNHTLEVRSHRQANLHVIELLQLFLIFCFLRTHGVYLIRFIFQWLRCVGVFYKPGVFARRQKIVDCYYMNHEVVQNIDTAIDWNILPGHYIFKRLLQLVVIYSYAEIEKSKQEEIKKSCAVNTLLNSSWQLIGHFQLI